jgi:hypothetical protein
MARTNFEELEVNKLSERLAHEIWAAVSSRDHFARTQLGSRSLGPQTVLEQTSD